MKRYGYYSVTSSAKLAAGVFDLRVYAPDITETARAGQFVNIFLDDSGRLLPRPLSICEIDRERGTFRIVFRVAGKGTEILSGLRHGDEIKILGPLGNGFPVLEMGKRVAVVGGGIGIPPMLGLAEALKNCGNGTEVSAFLGYRDSGTFLSEDFAVSCRSVNITSDDGSAGFKGNAADCLRERWNDGGGFDTVCACGPLPMLRAVAEISDEKGVKCFVSMEERMACGVGACLGCAVKAAEGDGFVYKKVCKDGPVFEASEVLRGV